MRQAIAGSRLEMSLVFWCPPLHGLPFDGANESIMNLQTKSSFDRNWKVLLFHMGTPPTSLFGVGGGVALQSNSWSYVLGKLLLLA